MNEKTQKNKTIEIPAEYENCAGRKVVFNDGYVDITFKKSGNTLRFDAKNFPNAEISDFLETERAFDDIRVKNAIIDELRKSDTYINSINVNIYEKDKDSLFDKLSSDDIEQWYNQELETASADADSAARFVYRLGNTAFDQNLKPLEDQFRINYVTINKDSDTPQTYYTRMENNDGRQQWYKAVDPLGWFGERLDDGPTEK